MSNAVGRLLEDNLDRVVDRVFRGMSSEPGCRDESAPVDDVADMDQSRDTMADLCGHVAQALKALESTPAAVASYRSVRAPAGTPTLDLVR